ncbi:hypothetical protein V5O48_019566, partial [Marasmius crinis-equi]
HLHHRKQCQPVPHGDLQSCWCCHYQIHPHLFSDNSWRSHSRHWHHSCLCGRTTRCPSEQLDELYPSSSKPTRFP